MYIKLPMYLFFLYGAWTWMWANHSTALGPMALSSPFQAQKSLDFQGPPLPMAIKMYLSTSKSFLPVPYKQQVH